MEQGSPLLIILLLGAVVAFVGILYPFRPFYKRSRAFLAFVVCLILVGALTPNTANNPVDGASHSTTVEKSTDAGQEMWVTSDRLNRRTCPSTRCGVVGQFFFRGGVSVLEAKGEWARVSKYYDASCSNGRSDYVDSGNAACTSDNGITDGQMAEWVSTEFLSANRPPDPAEGATGYDALVAQSDDYRVHREAFVAAARQLISSGRCTDSDFKDNGGWWKSTNRKNEPIYFMYCGRTGVSDRIYLNSETGKLFQ